MELEELDKEFDDILKKFPQARRKLVIKAGDKMESTVKSNIDNSCKEGTGNLKRAVTKKIGSKGGYAAVKNNYKIASYAESVENGHKVKGNANGDIQWVPGKHMYRNALNSLVDELENDAEQMLDELLGDLK